MRLRLRSPKLVRFPTAQRVLADSTDNRFAAHNEFRKQARDRDDQFATKTETAALAQQISDLKDRISHVETLKEGQTKTLTGLVTVIGVVLVVLNVVAFIIA